MRFILSIAAIFLMIFGLLGCQQNAPQTNTEKANINTAKQPEKTETPKKSNESPRITLADAKKDFDAGNAVFLDTRRESDFEMEHIKGAINFPPDKFEEKYKEIPKGKKIIAYCS